MTTKTSNSLLAAWFVLIACLVGAVVFFSMKTCAPPAEKPDAAVVPLPPPKGGVKPRTQPQPRHPGDHPGKPSAPSRPARRPVIEGIVRVPGGAPAGGVHVAVFEPSKAGKPIGPGNPDDLRQLNSIVYIATEEADTPRPLSQFTGDVDRSQAAETEVASDDTKDDGTFKITLPARNGAGPYRLLAKKENVGAATVNEVMADEEKLELMLGPASAVKGVVVTEVDSNPIEGAHVVFDNGARRFVADTDSAGKFTADGVTPGFYQLTVTAKGRVPLTEAKYKVDAVMMSGIQLRLPRGTRLTVKAVVEKDDAAARTKNDVPGDPVPDAMIWAYSEDMNAYVTAKANHDGVAEFPTPLPSGHWVLNGIAKGFVSMGEVAITIARTELAQEEQVAFEKGVETPIEVVDEDGRPVAGMDFYTLNNDDKYDQVLSMKAGTTDSDGKLRFPFEFSGPRAKLFGFKSGFAALPAAPDDRESGEVLKLVAKKPVHVHGVVKSSEGKAVPNAMVLIEVQPTNPDDGEDFSLVLRADADGRYDCANIPRVEGVTVGAAGPDGISQEDKDLELSAGKNDYEMDLVLDLEDEAPSTVEPKAVKPAVEGPPKGMRPGDKPPK